MLPEDDPLVNLAEESVTLTNTAAVPGRFLVDTVPVLQYIPAWVPGATFQRIAQQGKLLLDELVENPFNLVKKELVRDFF